MNEREEIINNYIQGYNSFDTNKMVRDFSDDIIFVNIQNGQISMTLNGIEEFTKQAETTTQFFSQRNQAILKFKHDVEKTEIEIDYQGVLATDLPSGLKKGLEIKLKGKSIFEFSGNKIIKLTDES